jgi:hypothetical protein
MFDTERRRKHRRPVEAISSHQTLRTQTLLTRARRIHSEDCQINW